MSMQNQKPVATFMRKMLSLAALLMFVIISATSSQAQQVKTPERGFAPAGSYLLSEIESISTAGGNLSYSIPLAKLPAGRAGSSAGVSLVYNSKLYDSYLDVDSGTGTSVEKLSVSPHGGWRFAYDYKLHVQLRPDRDLYSCTDPRYVQSVRLLVSFPDGSTKEFRPTGWNDLDGYYELFPDGRSTSCNGGFATTSKLTYYSIDGSYIRLDVEHEAQDDGIWQNNEWTLFFPDGSMATGTNATRNLFDRNGNQIRIRPTTYNMHDATRIFDQLEREIIIEYTTAGVSYVHQKGVNGELMTWTINWTTIQGSTYTSNGNIYGLDALSVISQVTLPSQAGSLSYSFTYHTASTQPLGYGEVASITLPTGASASYSYQYHGNNDFALVLDNSPTQKSLSYQREYDGSSTQATEVWTYSLSALSGGPATITGPDGGITSEYIGSNLVAPDYSFGQAYKSEYPNGTKVERIWQANNPRGTSHTINPCLKKEFTSIKNASGSYVLTAIKTFNYDKNGNVTEVKEYDWVNYGDVVRSNGRPTDAVPGSAVLKRVTGNTYYYPTPDSSSNAFAADAYHNASSPAVRNALATTAIGDGSQTWAYSEYIYDGGGNPIKGNLTTEKMWDSTKGLVGSPLTGANSISVTHAYDSNGNLTSTTDAKGYQTRMTYGNITGYNSVVYANLYPTRIERAFGTGRQLTTDKLYDFSTGLETEVKDVDNNVRTTSSYDVFGRAVLVKKADGEGEETRTAMEYSNVYRRVITKSDLSTAGDGKLVTIEHYDQLGRVRLTRHLEDASVEDPTNEQHGIKVQTRYQFTSTNFYSLSSNPYRAATSSAASGEATMGWSRSKNDNGGRLRESESFSGTSLPAPWGSSTSSTGKVLTDYNANATTFTDQTNKLRRNVVDGLGRLIRVDEPNSAGNLDVSGSPAQPTNYTYSPLGNLTQVQQIQGSPSVTQTRTFGYDSLKRLSSANNPESGLVSYTYDNNSNLATRTDARSIVATYAYDELNRITSRTYSSHTAATPNVYYFYDAQTLPSGAPAINRGSSKGRLVAVTYGTSISSSTGSYYGYDKLGRTNESYQRTDGENYRFLYQYNKAGAMTAETYPSNKVVETAYDAAGRIAGVRNQGSSSYYAGGAATDATNRIAYAAHGAMQRIQLGNALIEQTAFNSRLQPTAIKLGTSASASSVLQLDYAYGSSGQNNGNVSSQVITMPKTAGGTLTLTQSYTYDELNRLKTAGETGGSSNWSETFNYDRFGNMWVSPASGITLSAHTPQSVSDFAQGSNRLSMTNITYDSVGNLTKDTLNRQFKYDAENRQYDYQSGTTTYGYDGEGHRVRKQDTTGTLVYVYNAQGQLIAEYTSGTPSGGGTSYLTTDHLSSTRVVTKGDGSVRSRYDYLPFGEEVTLSRSVVTGFGATDSTKQKFTGQERDIESGLDYFLARYYSSGQMKFMSPDQPFSDQWKNDPQSWNLYTYVRNNPLRYTDPFGLWKEISPGVWQWEDKDTWETLALILNVDVERLKGVFPGAELGEGVALQPGDLSMGPPVQAAKACNCYLERIGNGWSYGYTYSNAELEVDVLYKRNWLNANTSVDYSNVSVWGVLRAFEQNAVGVKDDFPMVPAIGAHKYAGKTVEEILKLKKGSIKNASLEPGSPSWSDIGKKTWEQIESAAQSKTPGYQTIKKLLTDGRFDK